jgi:SAM-dependent methyltransferase
VIDGSNHPANPWLRIPAADYEAHMAGAGQSAVLRDVFARVYAESRPRRLLVLGCTTGRDLALIDPHVTTTVVGVDVNAKYLDAARHELGRLGRRADLIHADVLDVALPPCGFDLVHAALIVEYVDPGALFGRIAGWLAPFGICSVVSQNPAAGVPSVSRTGYSSLHALDGCMTLHTANRIHAFAAGAGLDRVAVEAVGLPGGKSFAVSTFRKGGPPA